MPTYPLIHKETGEQKELVMTMVEYVQWCKDNPDWKKDWSDKSTQSVTYGDTFFSGTKYPDSHNRNKNPDWY
tara:strand:- start:476 stop:691 length:216 start_codon:yes stop_codon:yes gene_type:complete